MTSDQKTLNKLSQGRQLLQAGYFEEAVVCFEEE